MTELLPILNLKGIDPKVLQDTKQTLLEIAALPANVNLFPDKSEIWDISIMRTKVDGLKNKYREALKTIGIDISPDLNLITVNEIRENSAQYVEAIEAWGNR